MLFYIVCLLIVYGFMLLFYLNKEINSLSIKYINSIQSQEN